MHFEQFYQQVQGRVESAKKGVEKQEIILQKKKELHKKETNYLNFLDSTKTIFEQKQKGAKGIAEWDITETLTEGNISIYSDKILYHTLEKHELILGTASSQTLTLYFIHRSDKKREPYRIIPFFTRCYNPKYIEEFNALFNKEYCLESKFATEKEARTILEKAKKILSKEYRQSVQEVQTIFDMLSHS